MPVTMQQVLAEIDRDEPNYAAFAQLGPEALPHLKQIIAANDPLKAAKAAYAATVIGGEASIDVLREAADHHDPQVRIAVAHGLQNMQNVAPSDLVMKTMNDSDSGVRKLALKTAAKLDRADLNASIAAMAKSDPEEHLRNAAINTTKHLKNK